MTKKEYRAKKMEEFNGRFTDWNSPRFFTENTTPEKILAFIAQTIEELWALPKNRMNKEPLVEDKEYTDGWNACIAEAERMRDLTAK
jgi:hypothetical protein